MSSTGMLVGRGVATGVLLVASNTFMTTAWYYHLKRTDWTMPFAIFISWLIASMEYCLQVPANRIGYINDGGPFTSAQLKIIQEAISLTVFGFFSVLVLKDKLKWTDLAAFLLILSGVLVGMLGPELLAKRADDGYAQLSDENWAARNSTSNGTVIEMAS